MPHDYFRYTAEGIGQVATEAGFTVLRSTRIGSRRETLAALSGWWSLALPTHVFEGPTDAFYHTAWVLLQRPLSAS